MPNTSILLVIERIYRYQLKCNYLKIQKHFGNFFTCLESTLNFEHLFQKNEPHSLNISEVIASERCAYLNA